jgi:hypothetical protein
MKRLLIIVLLLSLRASAADPSFKLGLLKYNGGGDWYANLETSLPNLIRFTNENLGTNINPEQGIVEVGSPEIFNYPFIHMTGHGNWVLSAIEAENLRKYLAGGGFLHIDDNYGLDPYVRPQMKKVFPELDFVELPFSHPIYHQKFEFADGLPKIHEHDGKAPQGFGLVYEGRLVCFYTHECDLGDGWEDYEVHKDSPELHQKALKMGADILQYVFKLQ